MGYCEEYFVKKRKIKSKPLILKQKKIRVGSALVLLKVKKKEERKTNKLDNRKHSVATFFVWMLSFQPKSLGERPKA